MADADTTLKVTVLGDASSLEKAFKKGGDDADGFMQKMKGIGAAIAGAFVVHEVGEFLGGAITAASDLNETVSKTAQVFGNAADASEVYAQAMGAAQEAAQKATAKYHDAAKKGEAELAELRAEGKVKHAELAAAVEEAEARQTTAVQESAQAKERAHDQYEATVARAHDAVVTAETNLADVARDQAQRVGDAKTALADVVEAGQRRIEDAERGAARSVEDATDRQEQAYIRAARSREDSARRVAEAEDELRKAQESGANAATIERLTERVNDARLNQSRVTQDTAHAMEEADKNLARVKEDSTRNVARAHDDAAKAAENAETRVSRAEAEQGRKVGEARDAVKKAKDDEVSIRNKAGDDLERAEKRAEKIVTDAAAAVAAARKALQKQADDQAEAEGKVQAKVESFRVKMNAATGEVIRLEGEIADAKKNASKVSKAETDKILADLDRWSSGAAKHMGLSKKEALDGASTMAMFGKAAGLTGTDLSKFSKDLVQLSGDLGSFHNAEPAEVVQALGAALRGEAEPMRRFGVNINAITLETEAMNMKIWDGHGAMTQQQKILAANSLIFKQTKDAQGDYARTADGLANSQRTQNKEWENAKATLGQGLLPIQLEFTKAMTDLIPAFTNVASTLTKVLNPAWDGLKWIFGFVADHKAEFIAFFGVALVGALTIVIPMIYTKATAWWAAHGAMIAAHAPIVAIIAAVALLAAGLVWAYKNVDWFRDSVNAVWAFMKNSLWPILQDVGKWFGETAVTAIGLAKAAWDTVLYPMFQAIWGFINDPLLPILATLGDWFVTVIVGAFGIAKGAWDNVLYPMFQAIWGFINDPLLPILGTLAGWFVTGLTGAWNTAKWAWDNVLQPMFKAVWGFVNDPLMPMLTTLAGFFKDVLTGAWGVAKAAWDNVLQPMFKAIGDFVTDPVLKILGTLADWFSKGIGAAWGVAKAAWDTVLQPMFKGIADFVGDPVLKVLGTLYDWFNTGIGLALGVAKGAFDLMWSGVQLVLTPFEQAVSLIKGGVEALPGLVDKLTGPFKTVFGTIWDVISPVYEAMKWIIEHLPSMPNIGPGGATNTNTGQGLSKSSKPMEFKDGRWVYKDTGVAVPDYDLNDSQQANNRAGSLGGITATVGASGNAGAGAQGGGISGYNSQGGAIYVPPAGYTLNGATGQFVSPTGQVWVPGSAGGDVDPEGVDDDEYIGTRRPGETGLTDDAVRVRRAIQAGFKGFTSIGGYDPTRPDYSDHKRGKALDVMMPFLHAPLGDDIARWAIHQNETKYVIWDNQIWSRTHPSWRSYATSGGAVGKKNQANPTGRHEDHVHISVLGNGGVALARAGGTAAILAEAGDDEAVVPLSRANPHARRFGAMVAQEVRTQAQGTGDLHVHLNVTVQGSLIHQRELEAMLRDVLSDTRSLMAVRDGLIEMRNNGITLGLS